ncbi:stearoyl-CoA 9-desaturase [Ascosphaera pollenicola]|nr:stearoyl-CoA 9-desaturase [Ascosphaera pollenicola]
MDLRTIVNPSDAVDEPKKSGTSSSSPRSAAHRPSFSSHHAGNEDPRRGSDSFRPPYSHHQAALTSASSTTASSHANDEVQRLSITQPTLPQPMLAGSPGTALPFVPAQSPYHHHSLPHLYGPAGAGAVGPQFPAQDSYFQAFAQQPARQRAESLSTHSNVPTAAAYNQSIPGHPTPYTPHALRQATPPRIFPPSHASSHHQSSSPYSYTFPPPPSADRESFASGGLPHRGSQQISPLEQQYPQQHQQQQPQQILISPREHRRLSIVQDLQQQSQQQLSHTIASRHWNPPDRETQAQAQWESREIALRSTQQAQAPQLYQPPRKVIQSRPSTHHVQPISRHDSDGDTIMSPITRPGRNSVSSNDRDPINAQRNSNQRTMEEKQPATTRIQNQNDTAAPAAGPIDQAHTNTARYSRPPSPHPHQQAPSARQSTASTNSKAYPPSDHSSAARGSIDASAQRHSSPAHPAEPPLKKRRRYSEIPLWARKAPRKYGLPPAIPPPEHRTPYVPVSSAARRHPGYDKAADLPPTSRHTASAERPKEPSSRVPPQEYPNDEIPFRDEPSFTGEIPHEDLSKQVADFLFEQVVKRTDIGVSHLGGSSNGHGAVLEVEAKLGRFIDKDSQQHFQLPIKTETILLKDRTGPHLYFESYMTLNQHRCLNEFLNRAAEQSKLPNPTRKRIPMEYVHNRQIDAFYEIPPESLPPMIRPYFNRRHNPRVRVTRDQKTGNVIAKIVKCRVADLDVYSPGTALDWRLSVNIEMDYEGDIQGLVPLGEGGDPNSRVERIKDRVSYMHMFSRIDLTQVEDPKTQPGLPPRLIHEVEVEISTAEVRRQGQKVIAHTGNQYGELIKAYVDNIRILTRKVPPFD